MLEKNQSQTKIQIVDFLDIDTSKITFKKPKSNKYNGSQIGILYNGDTMFVKYEGVTPFGLQENFDKDGNYQGTTLSINCKDKYLEKAKELDKFFINAFYQNKWSLNRNIPLSHIEGYDDHGQGGLWKRICKDPYRVDRDTKEREYLDYPSKMEFSLFYRNNTLETQMFSWDSKKLPNDSEIGPRSRVKFIAAWFSLSRGSFGLSLKPKLMQVMFRNELNDFEDCMLNTIEEEEEPTKIPKHTNSEYGYPEDVDIEWIHEK